MPEPTPPTCTRDRAVLELRCLGKAVIPMPEDNGRRVAKAVALVLVLTWCLTTLALTFEAVATVNPPFYTAFTAVVFLVVGKLWDIEVRSVMGK